MLGYVGVSKNNGTPKSSILIGFSIIFTIHFGIPLFLETPMLAYRSVILFFSQKSSNAFAPWQLSPHDVLPALRLTVDGYHDEPETNGFVTHWTSGIGLFMAASRFCEFEESHLTFTKQLIWVAFFFFTFQPS